MSIDKLIAKIPTMSPDERKTMRANAEAKAMQDMLLVACARLNDAVLPFLEIQN
jgi:hypothetical protein